MPETTKYGELLRHPLTIVLISFVLTGVLGVAFSQWIANWAKEADQARLETESRKVAVQNLSRSIYERRARAEMLASSFLRGAQLDEVKERKKLYDEALVRWNSNNHTNLFLVREVLRSEEYSIIEASLEFTLVERIFKPLDVCLTQAYDAVIAGNPATNIMQECQTRKLLQEALDCGYAIADELYKLSSSVTTADRASFAIVARCPK
jgi:hypothetical protein